MNRPPCKRCLLRDMDDGSYARTIGEYVESLSPERRASEEVLQARLELCRTCDYLSNGLCGLCGCFVEARAAKKDSVCPAVPARWGKEILRD